MLASIAFTLAALAYGVAADPVPLEPSSASVFNEGSNCTILWTPDTTGTWTTMYIELMTGDNLHQVHLKTVATVDGTDTTNHQFSYPCLDVTPNSAIYFYKFTSPAYTGEPLFTTRFTIADATGNSVPPTETDTTVTPNVLWGTGALTDPSQGDAPPPTSGGTTGNSTSVTSSRSSTAGGSSTTSTRVSSGTTTSTATTTSRTNAASKLAVGSAAFGAFGALVAAAFL